MTENKRVEEFFTPHNQLLIQQKKEWTEIITNFETRNKYQILSTQGVELGFMAEQGSGFGAMLSRWFLRTHRPMKVMVWGADREELMQLERPFFWFFSDLTVRDPQGNILGHVYRKFGILHKKYDLATDTDKIFARVVSPIWRLWTFFIKDNTEREIGTISKNWGGLLKEMFTDADRFQVSFGNQNWREKAVIFASAISIDMDFFDDNQRNN
ncbi:MAG: hypothetical protein KC493_17590 [Bacteriovoracaceae bacterium]|nr:hypothetical protein [Bacteriovoracaceae bacterium]